MASRLTHLFTRVDRPATCNRCGRKSLGWSQLKTGKWLLCETTQRDPKSSYRESGAAAEGLWAIKTKPHRCYEVEICESLELFVAKLRQVVQVYDVLAQLEQRGDLTREQLAQVRADLSNLSPVEA